MVNKVIIPDFGTSVEEVRLVRWLKKEGDTVKKGDALCELETDKATTELETCPPVTLAPNTICCPLTSTEKV